MQKIIIAIAVGLMLNLPSTALGQIPEGGVLLLPADVVELRVRIGGAVRNAGLFDLEPTLTVSGALALAGGPTLLAEEDKVWVFRDGEIVTTLLQGTTLIADAPIRSGDQLFVAWVSTVPERSWISLNPGLFGAMVGGAVGLAITFIR